MSKLSENLKSLVTDVMLTSQRTGIPIDKLNQIISGEKEPNLKEIKVLSTYLKINASDLVSTNSDKISALFRSSTNNMYPLQSARLSSIGSLSSLFSNDVQPNYPQNFVSENIEQSAFHTRTILYGKTTHGPIPNLGEIVSSSTFIDLYVKDIGADGACFNIDGRYTIVLSPRTSKERMLFTLAHELGHIFLGHLESSNVVVDDDSYANIAAKSQTERDANKFATCLLLPAKSIGAFLTQFRDRNNYKGDLGDIEIFYLAEYFNVSFITAALRCEYLNLLPKGGAISISEQIIKDYGTMAKRQNDIGIIKTNNTINIPGYPTSILDKVIDKIGRGDLSIGKASQLLSIGIGNLMGYEENSYS